MRPGAPVYETGLPLSVELAPGLLRSIFDGVQRPLPVIEARTGSFIERGVHLDSLYRKDRWDFTPKLQAGDKVSGGSILGSVPETEALEHRVMVPPDVEGTLTWIAPAKAYTIEETIAKVDTGSGEVELAMLQRWPVRRPRPYRMRRAMSEPLITGQRVLDTFFPIAKGGTAAIPGAFGSGKTVTQHSIAKWADAQVIVYIGCGERGNEMTEVLQEFPHLVDPRTDRPLMERTVLIANTSNMPVAAREASIYTGITIAEYYRDMGYHVALMADSTSRWAEALREISGRLEELPAEEGYPAYLADRLAEFYERAGHVETLNGQAGSISVVGAVSPPGGDFSEPVTQHTSYSEYIEGVAGWWREEVGQDWFAMRTYAMELLSEESRLQQIVKLVGSDTLPDEQRLILETARLIREGFLQQNSFDPIDAYSPVEKQIRMLGLILNFHRRAQRIIKRGALVTMIHDLPVVNTLIRMKTLVDNENLSKFDDIQKEIDQQLEKLEAEYQ
jgi:V/A-type H+-transporting ATPase subunit A